jgi:hypothetical protein
MTIVGGLPAFRPCGKDRRNGGLAYFFNFAAVAQW